MTSCVNSQTGDWEKNSVRPLGFRGIKASNEGVVDAFPLGVGTIRSGPQDRNLLSAFHSHSPHIASRIDPLAGLVDVIIFFLRWNSFDLNRRDFLLMSFFHIFTSRLFDEWDEAKYAQSA